MSRPSRKKAAVIKQLKARLAARSEPEQSKFMSSAPPVKPLPEPGIVKSTFLSIDDGARSMLSAVTGREKRSEMKAFGKTLEDAEELLQHMEDGTEIIEVEKLVEQEQDSPHKQLSRAQWM